MKKKKKQQYFSYERKNLPNCDFWIDREKIILLNSFCQRRIQTESTKRYSFLLEDKKKNTRNVNFNLSVYFSLKNSGKFILYKIFLILKRMQVEGECEYFFRALVSFNYRKCMFVACFSEGVCVQRMFGSFLYI